MRTIRLYMGELDSDYVEAEVTELALKRLQATGSVAVDDGGHWFIELPLTYRQASLGEEIGYGDDPEP